MVGVAPPKFTAEGALKALLPPKGSKTSAFFAGWAGDEEKGSNVLEAGAVEAEVEKGSKSAAGFVTTGVGSEKLKRSISAEGAGGGTGFSKAAPPLPPAFLICTLNFPPAAAGDEASSFSEGGRTTVGLM